MTFLPRIMPAAVNGAARRSDRLSHILLVDDRPDKLMMMEAALCPLGHEIMKAGSGREALRWLLRQDFAVVLLDMNMPGLDGFDTARLIRQRRRNQHTPLIFITAYGDDIHAIQCYSLGAVDFLLAPVVPEVLRSKVSVFLELYDRTAEVRQQAERLLQRTQQLQALTRASLEIHGALTVEQTLQIAADSAQNIIGSRAACAVVMANQSGLHQHQLVVSPVQRALPAAGALLDADLQQVVVRLSKSVRLKAAEMATPTIERLFPNHSSAVFTDGMMAPLVGRNATNMGLLIVAAKRDGEFSDDDEALLVQLAQMAATAVENTLFAEAREANRMKDEFLATLSHELRTPLSSILGWAQLLRAQMLDPEETIDAVEIIERNAQIQCKLIEDLLDVSRIVTGKMQLRIRPLDLAEVVEAAVNVVLPAAQAKQVRIDVVVEDELVQVDGDADRLQQVLWNLLSNAVKFTPALGHVDVRLETVGPHAQIRVQDDGEGIAPEFLPHVFDRFRQADSSTSRQHGGLGIGLAIARHVVELHGGTVAAQSAGKGYGTTFVVELPLAPAEADSPDEPERAKAHPRREPVGQNGMQVVT